MREGWYKDEYLILFDEAEHASMTSAYAVNQRLPGYIVIGLRGGDDFLLRNRSGDIFTVRTVPAVPQYIAPFQLPSDPGALKRDKHFEGRIKWYLTPLVFGGDRSPGSNIVWIDLYQHIDLVRWWNRKYDEVTATQR
jgi:hypothetical protein